MNFLSPSIHFCSFQSLHQLFRTAPSRAHTLFNCILLSVTVRGPIFENLVLLSNILEQYFPSYQASVLDFKPSSCNSQPRPSLPSSHTFSKSTPLLREQEPQHDTGTAASLPVLGQARLLLHQARTQSQLAISTTTHLQTTTPSQDVMEELHT